MSTTPRYEFSAQPLLILSGAFALGILAGPVLSGGFRLLGLVSIAGFILAFAFLQKRWFKAATVIVFFCFCCAGATVQRLDAKVLSSKRIKARCEDGVLRPDEPIEVTGVLSREPEPSAEGFYLTVRVETIGDRNQESPASGLVGLWASTSDAAVRAEYDALDLRYGTHLRVMTMLDRDERFRNPGVVSRKRILDEQGLDATGAIKSPLLVERLGDERTFLPVAIVYRWRTQLLAKLRVTFSVDTAGLIEAAYLGNRFDLTKDVADRFRENGAFHILVISGFHIAVLGLAFFWLTSKLTSRPLLQYLIPVLSLWLYSFAVGAGVPVLRAAIVLTLMSFARIVHRKAASLNSLGFAALVLLLVQPAAIFDASFQLTVLSVLSILTIALPILSGLEKIGRWRPSSSAPYPPLCPGWYRIVSEALYWSEREWRRDMIGSVVRYRLFKTSLAPILERMRLQTVLRFLVSALVVSASVQIGLLPLQAIYFHRISVTPLLVNIAIGPLSILVLSEHLSL